VANKIKNPRLVKNPWGLPTPSKFVKSPDEPLTRGQELLVDCNEGFEFIPCFPKPGAKKTITRVANGTWIVYLGLVEFNGATCLEFMTQKGEEFFYLGDGALPYLVNIPKKPTKAGHPFHKKLGSALGAGGHKRRRRGNHKRLGTGLKKLPAPGENKPSEPKPQND